MISPIAQTTDTTGITGTAATAGAAQPCPGAHPVRLRLLRTLARGPRTTREAAHVWDLSPSEVSRHLAALCRADLLTARRHGRHVRYTLNLPDLATVDTDLPAAVPR
ncbi:hypothetical protein GCM10023084_01380 [Streptomyces lacrimifluminis]|uniref:HTH arsR-type domain-containing protein n=1 Tax=Streptomyces lacrimifluminis TaxID=1500077 RepID=A0A917KMK1_9ACTN|nr:hypothetical protein GCM10012282_16460 [Streptomyces lacrimifluminis]